MSGWLHYEREIPPELAGGDELAAHWGRPGPWRPTCAGAMTQH